MEHKPAQLCRLRPEFKDLELADQAALILGCRLADAEYARLLERKHKELADWIRSE